VRLTEPLASSCGNSKTAAYQFRYKSRRRLFLASNLNSEGIDEPAEKSIPIPAIDKRDSYGWTARRDFAFCSLIDRLLLFVTLRKFVKPKPAEQDDLYCHS
jgi:hypothetical protein